jgi:hypothetical protein
VTSQRKPRLASSRKLIPSLRLHSPDHAPGCRTDQFQVSVDEVLDRIPPARRPSRATGYRIANRLANEPIAAVTVTKDEQGNFYYSWLPEGVSSQPARDSGLSVVQQVRQLGADLRDAKNTIRTQAAKISRLELELAEARRENAHLHEVQRELEKIRRLA